MPAAHATVLIGTPERGAVELGSGRPKIIVPLMPASVDEVPAAVAALEGQPVDVVEWRVDHVALPEEADAVGAALRAALTRADGSGLPLLTTYRTDREGGVGSLPDGEYAAFVVSLLGQGLADAVDVEYRRDRACVDALVGAARSAGIPVVTSFHDFDSTPTADSIVEHLRLQAAVGGDVLKVAVMPHTAVDVAALLTATAQATQELDQPVLTISMGQLGLVSRVAAETFGACATFAMVGEASAPGQIPADELAQVLRLFSLS